MFRKQSELIGGVLQQYIREQGLETPLLQKRLVDSIPTVMGETLAAYFENPYIKNQVLFVHVKNPALRADLTMSRSKYVALLNAAVNSTIIVDIRFV